MSLLSGFVQEHIQQGHLGNTHDLTKPSVVIHLQWYCCLDLALQLTVQGEGDISVRGSFLTQWQENSIAFIVH